MDGSALDAGCHGAERCDRWAAPVCLAALVSVLAAMPAARAAQVMITPEIASVEVLHEGRAVIVERNQDRRNTVNPYYAHTSRKCPPFCIQPIRIAPGVETLGELEVLAYLERRAEGDESVLVVDARQSQWIARGMIPGAVNVPWTLLDPEQARPEAIRKLLVEGFDVVDASGLLVFTQAKTLVLYCNGPWCSQSTNSVRSLLRLGYPANRLKWYRGGMQAWESVGLTTMRSSP